MGATETLSMPAAELATGQTFAGRYQIIEELGRGGMGIVYKAQDAEVGEKVALKILKPEVAADEDMIRRFRNELKLARTVAHRNVCRMYDLGRAEGTTFITMEYVSGEDLKSFIRRSGQLTVGKTLTVAAEIVEGLAEAHRHGVIHRDLKPQNIMIDREGNALIMDFGIARTLGSAGSTRAGLVIGTPEYMAPEQVDGREADQRTDLYAMGMILYEMLTGRTAFEADSPLAAALKQKTEPPSDPRTLNAQVPPELSRVVLRCLAKDKADRYQNADDLLAALADLRTAYPSSERVLPRKLPSTAKDTFFGRQWRRLAWPAAGVAALALLGFLAWRIFLEPGAGPSSLAAGDKLSLAVVYFENVSGDPALESWRTGLAELLITDLEQSRYLHVLSGDALYGLLKKLKLQDVRRYSTEDLVSVAEAGKVSHVVSGSLMRAGNGILITLRFQKPRTGEVIRSERLEARGESEFAAKVDEMMRLIKADMKLTPSQLAGDIDESVGKITSASAGALKYFVDGYKLFRSGEYGKAIPYFENAVAVDPQFATAFDALAYSYGNTGYRSEYKKYIRKAFEASAQASELERLRIRGNYFMGSEKTYDKAVAEFERLIDLYPDYQAARSQLGFAYGLSEEWDKAISQYERIVAKGTEEFLPYNNLCVYLTAAGRADRAREILADYVRRYADNAGVHRALVLGYLGEGKLKEAGVEAEVLHGLSPRAYGFHHVLGIIRLLEGDMAAAEKEFLALLEAPEPIAHLIGRHRLGNLYLLQGRFAKAQEQGRLGLEQAKAIHEATWEANLNLDESYRNLARGDWDGALAAADEARRAAAESDLDLTLQRTALCYKGLALTEKKAASEARRAALDLEDLLKLGLNKMQARYLHLLNGVRELHQANYPKAIQELEQAAAFLAHQYFSFPIDESQALFYAPLADAYFRSGDLLKSRGWYEKILSLTTGRLAFGDLYARSVLALARIDDEQGHIERAREGYRKFLEIWKDGDPGLPEIAEARRRLAALH